MEIFKPGTSVDFGGGAATVAKVELTESGPSYLVVWWVGRGERKEAWVQPHELTPREIGREKIDFWAPPDGSLQLCPEAADCLRWLMHRRGESGIPGMILPNEPLREKLREMAAIIWDRQGIDFEAYT